ncbi:MAG TPA: hydroxymethylbilane synthase, partial [Nitrospiraceae bacterium]|nr:hydroxymethylbilane synthase [Nitrospiraceae bacterium]
LDQLPKGSRVGTSSLRRQAQLLHHRPDLRIDLLRGNLDTRLRRLHNGEYDAIVLAAAGLTRMGWSNKVTEYLPPEVSLPAIGQGALGLEGRRDDGFVQTLVEKLEHRPTRTAVMAERALLERLEGGCQVPIAAHATIKGDILIMDGLIASVDGRRLIRDTIQGPASEAHGLGTRLADKLLAQGGNLILNEIYGNT